MVGIYHMFSEFRFIIYFPLFYKDFTDPYGLNASILISEC